MIRSAVELFRSTARHTVPDLVSGPARRALAHGRADAPRVTSAQIGETERRARALERDRRPRTQEVEEGQAMRLFERLRRMIVENRRVRKSIEARRARRCRRSMR